MAKQQSIDSEILFSALKAIGNNESARKEFTKLLIKVEKILTIKNKSIRDEITGPLVDSLYADSSVLRKTIKGGLIFDFYYNSKIAREFIMSIEVEPDHIWEPQTTKVLKYFSKGAENVVIGGAFFGDHAIIVAHELLKNNGVCHAFEPNPRQCEMLRRNAKNNRLNNIIINEKALWKDSNSRLQLMDKSSGNHNDNKSIKPFYLTDEGNFSTAIAEERVYNAESSIQAISIDDYGQENGLEKIELIMLDLEGGEQAALEGAEYYLRKNKQSSPVIVFEIHRHYADWSNGLEKTGIISLLKKYDYEVYAIRDFQANVPIGDSPIELIPVKKVYLEGPPHGFNMLALKDRSRLDDKFRFCENVSPKLLMHKDPEIHHPLY